MAADVGLTAGSIVAAFGGDVLLKSMKAPGTALVYYAYCHAYEPGGPFLSFRVDETHDAGTIGINDLQVAEFAEGIRPLVFLNACATAGLSAQGLSDLVRTLVDLRASGVVATEAEVHQVTAAFMGRRLLEMLLAGKPDGGRRCVVERSP